MKRCQFPLYISKRRPHLLQICRPLVSVIPTILCDVELCLSAEFLTIVRGDLKNHQLLHLITG
ncbi:hypothetical protein T4B_12338 [Trichinella pseudospiralis]|uniref:Uncharacterized protein n=1 Tax=Trichinella pseudospiralis TaxID=6337 RepID=A0A0V1JI07_TRIPS|nr:hypothetical protein T4B_12338 [Trichinella pseudospiralis]KRZ45500.1 hypothetical protein T4C_3200 [Trichinella pseudospiralis]